MTKLLEVGKKYKHIQTGYVCICLFSSKQHLIIVLDRDPLREMRLTGDASQWFKEYKEPRRVMKYFNVYENKETGELETGGFMNSLESCLRFPEVNQRYKLIASGQELVWEESTDDKG